MFNSKFRCAALALSLGLSITTHAETLKIGHIATLSGPIGGLGQDQFDGFMLGIEQRGGKLAGHVIDVVRLDDQGKPDVGVQLARELIERDKVRLVVGGTASNVINAMFPVVTGAGIPLLGTNGGPSPIAGEKCSPMFVSTGIQNDVLHEAAGQEAQLQGYRRMVTIAPNYQAGKDAVAGFKRFYKGEVADEIYPAFGQTDFSAELARLAATPADAIYVFLPGGMGINFMKQYAQAGLTGKLPLLSSWTVDDLSLPAIKNAAAGSIVSAHWTSATDNQLSQTFVKDFQAKYRRTPSAFAAQGFDAAALLEQALQATPAAASDAGTLAKALRSARLASLRGDIRFGANGFPIQDYWIWKVVKRAGTIPAFEKDRIALAAHQDAYVAKCPVE